MLSQLTLITQAGNPDLAPNVFMIGTVYAGTFATLYRSVRSLAPPLFLARHPLSFGRARARFIVGMKVPGMHCELAYP